MEGADPKLGVEMRSTGEVACFGSTYPEALSLAFLATGHRIPAKGERGLALFEDAQTEERSSGIVKAYASKGVPIDFLRPGSSDKEFHEGVSKVSAGDYSFLLSFNTNSTGSKEQFQRVRRKAVDLQVQIFSTGEEAEAMLLCMK